MIKLFGRSLVVVIIIFSLASTLLNYVGIALDEEPLEYSGLLSVDEAPLNNNGFNVLSEFLIKNNMSSRPELYELIHAP